MRSIGAILRRRLACAPHGAAPLSGLAARADAAARRPIPALQSQPRLHLPPRRHVPNLLLTQQDKKTIATYGPLDEAQLPEGDIDGARRVVEPELQDALAVTGRGAIVRKWPLVPSIDLAGTVEQSASPEWKPGDRVVVSSWGLGETHWGGYAQKARACSRAGCRRRRRSARAGRCHRRQATPPRCA